MDSKASNTIQLSLKSQISEPSHSEHHQPYIETHDSNHVEYFEQEKTWFQAQRTCNNSGGWLTSNKNNVINCNQVTKGATFWTGEYSTISHWISKIGCIELLGDPHVSLVPTVSKCLEICRMRHIDVEILGHIKNRCVCISSNKPSLRKLVTIQQCHSYIASNNSYWAYSVTQNKTLTGPGNCVFVKCDFKPVVYAATCKDERRTFCDRASHLNWNLCQEHCKNKIPGNLSEICEGVQNDQTGVWLPMHRVVLRTDVLHDVIDNENTVLHCASYRCYYKTGVSTVLMNNSCTTKANGFFCTFASSSYNEATDRSYTTFNSTALNFKLTKANGTFENTANAFKITGTRSFTTSNVFQPATSNIVKVNDNRNLTEIPQNAATSYIGLIVGGVLGALVIICIIVLVVIKKLRGKAATKRQTMEQFEISKDKSTIDDDKQRGNKSNDKILNIQYEDDWAHAGRYFAEKIMETEMINAQEGKQPNDVYAVVMKDTMTSPLQVGLDCVVASEEVVESEYDRLNITPKVLTDNTENNIYDSSIADRCKSDPTYNTATHMILSRQINEDMYDRI
ncbi:Hypothetical predicted protein [Mytilus galloprovincialis]|uniref:C-type lectin domain-containing protein n=1 Tax=Mytilus galloprovincialis TaxID=29158 RepID=A0A8B6E2L2_MYTGA|nr:Hypothetical predicted protein [Mytilus galloprovincialis]